MGVSPSRLSGRGVVEHHEHFDAGGAYTGATVVHRQPEFTREDLARLIAYRRKQDEIGPYGVPLSEAMDPANQGMFESFNQTNYAVRSVEMAKAKAKVEFPHDPQYGFVWQVRRR